MATHPHYTDFGYSDGSSVEEAILVGITGCRDRSVFSEEIRSLIVDWPTEYHFSPLRHNLLRHMEFRPCHHILELGAGCGALTRQLGETGASVTAVEGSQMRARCAAARCADLDNVRVYCADFNTVDFEAKYDFVTLIGVLEYAPVFFDSGDPLGDCLRIVRRALKPSGQLLLAIENRLGLKYFLGCDDDHVGRPYVGLLDAYGPGTPVTLGRRELMTALESAGFASVRFSYPFPDYKLPGCVVTEEAFHVVGFDPAQLAAPFTSRNYGRPSRPLPPEGLMWRQLYQNGTMQDLANSFLVTASARAGNGRSSDQLLAVTYSLDRKPCYRTATRFTVESDGQVAVTKTRLDGRTEPPAGRMSIHLGRSPYVRGPILSTELLRALWRQDIDQFTAGCGSWVDYVEANGILAGGGAAHGHAVRPDFIDCIPQNLVVSAAGLQYIDREWSCNAPFSLDTLVVRGLFQLLGHGAHRPAISLGARSGYDFLVAAMERLGLTLSPATFQSFLEVETRLREETGGVPLAPEIKWLMSTGAPTRSARAWHMTTYWLRRGGRWVRKRLHRGTNCD